MLAYVATKEQFLDDAPDIHDIVQRAVEGHLGIRISSRSSEYASWQNSLGNAMFHALHTPDIPSDAGVAIEYRLHGRRQRIDFMVSGRDRAGTAHVVLIELKQWSEVAPSPLRECIRTYVGGSLRDMAHPSWQAWSYSTLLRDFYEVVNETPIAINPCAYLHNCSDDAVVRHAQNAEILDRAPVFLKHERQDLQQFISEHIATGDATDTLRTIEGSRMHPSKQLVAAVSSMLKGNDEFVLIDEQKVAFEQIMERVRNIAPTTRGVIVVQGGPGTGKSVIAVNALVRLLEEGYNARYVTKNAAPRAVYRAKLKGTRSQREITNLFVGSDGFVGAAPESFDVLLVDEAHRLTKLSGLYRNLGEHQIAEIIHSSRVAVFFLDEDQHVTWRDIGTTDEIIDCALLEGASIDQLELTAQFRCAGSDEYLHWVDNVLRLGTTHAVDLSSTEYDIRILESPDAVREAIIEKNNEGGTSRMLAGYCWEWISRNDPNAYDIDIPGSNFAMRWNLQSDGSAWMISPTSINEVGCIHTCQGLEGDYMGVLIGPDLRVQGGVLTGNPDGRARTDQSLRGFKKALNEGVPGAQDRADALIRKTYRTLLTRGARGTFIYCTDPAVRDLLRASLDAAHLHSPTKAHR